MQKDIEINSEPKYNLLIMHYETTVDLVIRIQIL